MFCAITAHDDAYLILSTLAASLASEACLPSLVTVPVFSDILLLLCFFALSLSCSQGLLFYYMSVG